PIGQPPNHGDPRLRWPHPGIALASPQSRATIAGRRPRPASTSLANCSFYSFALAPATRVYNRWRKSSDLGGGQELAARVEGIAPLGAPGTEQRAELHLGVRAPRRAGAAADLAAGHQVPQIALGAVVVGRHHRLGHKDEQLFEMPQDARAQLALYRRRPLGERRAVPLEVLLQAAAGAAARAP